MNTPDPNSDRLNVLVEELRQQYQHVLDEPLPAHLCVLIENLRNTDRSNELQFAKNDCPPPPPDASHALRSSEPI